MYRRTHVQDVKAVRKVNSSYIYIFTFNVCVCTLQSMYFPTNSNSWPWHFQKFKMHSVHIAHTTAIKILKDIISVLTLEETFHTQNLQPLIWEFNKKINGQNWTTSQICLVHNPAILRRAFLCSSSMKLWQKNGLLGLPPSHLSISHAHSRSLFFFAEKHLKTHLTDKPNKMQDHVVKK